MFPLLFQVDCGAILSMDDAVLTQFLPAVGDRYAVKDFCRCRTSHTESRKSSMLERLRSRVRAKSKSLGDSSHGSSETGQQVATTSHMKDNRFAQKPTRRIELGWVNYDLVSQSLKQVRAKTGGGIRHLVIDRNSTLDALLQVAHELFFPGGTSMRGEASTFRFSLTDYKYMDSALQETVGSLYDKSKMRMLRYYLRTDPIADAAHDNMDLMAVLDVVTSDVVTSVHYMKKKIYGPYRAPYSSLIFF